MALAEGSYLKAVHWAERAEERLMDAANLSGDLKEVCSDLFTVGALACCHLRNQTQDHRQRQDWSNDALHWLDLLRDLDPALLKLLLERNPTLRDLRHYAPSEALP